MDRLPHGYTNATRHVARGLVEKRYSAGARERAGVEAACLAGMQSILPVPELTSFDPDVPVLVMREAAGQHGQELIEAGHGAAVLRLTGSTLRILQQAPATAVKAPSGDGDVIAHGDFGPQNMLYDLDRNVVTAVLDSTGSSLIEASQSKTLPGPNGSSACTTRRSSSRFRRSSPAPAPHSTGPIDTTRCSADARSSVSFARPGTTRTEPSSGEPAPRRRLAGPSEPPDAAAALVRQLIECEYLLHAFVEDLDRAASWYRSTPSEIRRAFMPKKMRPLGGFSDHENWSHCDQGGHPSPHGRYLLRFGVHGRLEDDAVLTASMWGDLAQHLARVWWAVHELLSTHHARFVKVRASQIAAVDEIGARWAPSGRRRSPVTARRLLVVERGRRRRT